MSIINPPPKTTKNAKGNPVANPLFKKKDQLAHYITARGQYYCATLSELVLQVKKKRESLIKRVAARLNLFYDCASMGLCFDFGAILEGHPDVFFIVNDDVVHHRQPVCLPELRQRLPAPQVFQV